MLVVTACTNAQPAAQKNTDQSVQKTEKVQPETETGEKKTYDKKMVMCCNTAVWKCEQKPAKECPVDELIFPATAKGDANCSKNCKKPK